MESEQIEEFVQKIMWGCSISTIKDSNGNNIPVIFRPPNIEQKSFASYVYESELKNSIEYGIPTEEKILNVAKTNNIWTTEEDNYINKFDEIITFAKKELIASTSTIAKKNLENQIKQAYRTREKVQKKYLEILSKSAESIAREASATYLVAQTTFHLKSNELIFPDIESVQDEILIWNAVKAYLDSNKIIDTSLVRKIARSSHWRIRWNLNKNSLSELFGHTTRDLSHTQLNLVYWSQVYDSVYQSMDCPSDDIIDNDEELDKWLEEQRNRHNVDRANRQLDKKSGEKGFYDKNGKFHAAAPSVEDHHENFVVIQGYYDKDGYYREYTPEEKRARVAQIYGRNAPIVRGILANEQNKIEEAGTIKDGKLRNEKTYMILGAKVNKTNG